MGVNTGLILNNF